MDKVIQRMKNLECRKKIYQNRIKKGLCGLCGKPINGASKSMCEICLKELKKRNGIRRKLEPEKIKNELHKYSKKVHKEALEKIVKDKNILLRCPCGCSEIDLLEIDHLDENGNEERKKLSGQAFCRAIRDGERRTDDLTILCKVCNYIKFCNSKAKTGQWKTKFVANEG